MPSNVVKEMQAFLHGKIATLDKDEPYSKALLAKLRRAVGKPRNQTPDVWEITLHGAPENNLACDVIHTTLTLYALHRQGKDKDKDKDRTMNDGTTGFGTAISKLITPDKDNEKAIRRRFNAVATAQEFTELAYHARGLIQLLKADDIKMNYIAFAADLYFFQITSSRDGTSPRDKVLLEWGKQFYRTNTNTTDDNKGADENETIS